MAQGQLNRLIASVTWPSFPALNVTASFLGREGIRLALEGEATLFIPTMAGAVTSPEPYQMMTLTVHLLKSQALAALYKAQMEFQTLLGNGVIRSDSSVLPPYDITNAAIEAIEPQDYSGATANWILRFRGFYIVNNFLWS